MNLLKIIRNEDSKTISPIVMALTWMYLEVIGMMGERLLNDLFNEVISFFTVASDLFGRGLRIPWGQIHNLSGFYMKLYF